MRQQSFELAIQHINDAGGVLGQPVTFVLADPTFDPDVAVEEARRLIEVEGVHAIVGPSSSANALAVAEQVAGPAGIPLISPSATSPLLTTADDRDFFFRTALSDVAQGPVLARLTRERGFDNVGVLYRDDAWGRGLHEAFVAAWDGAITSVAIHPTAETHTRALRETFGRGAQALVLITFAAQAETILYEALELALYDQFVFSDGARRLALVQTFGGDRLGDMYGTAGVAHPGGEAQAAWEQAYREAYGELPVTPYVRATYDAAIAIALAAEAAGSLEGAAIRDQLRAIGGAPGRGGDRGPRGRRARPRDPRRWRRRSTTRAPRSRSTGTSTATCCEVTSGSGASPATSESRTSRRCRTASSRTADSRRAAVWSLGRNEPQP